MSPPKQCPCGSLKSLESCCGPYLAGQALAPNPEALMRSRYTAFSLQDLAYLRKTWHPETCPDDLDASEPSNWIKLEIIGSDYDDVEDDGEVEFRASLIYDNKLEVLHEISQFEKVDGAWLYHSGEFMNEGETKAQKISKTAPCPCGSGKSFKNCHYEG